jgi:hypothetical protein
MDRWTEDPAGKNSLSPTPTSPPLVVDDQEGNVVDTGYPISVYADAFADGSGGHLVHRNHRTHDGAIATYPRANPRYYLFRFGNQVF